MNFLQQNWQAVAGIIGGIIAWFGGRRLYSEKIKEKKASVISQIQESYRQYLQDDERERKDLHDRIKKLEEKLNDRDKQDMESRKKKEQLFQEVKNWEVKYERLLKDHEKLKRDFKTYKAKQSKTKK